MLCTITTGAQTGTKPLTVGDPVPPGLFAHLPGGNPARTAGFFRGLLILDFWATWCASCRYSFPRLQALQEQFGPELKVLLVNGAATGDDAGKVAAFFQKCRQRDGTPYSLEGVVGDTALPDLFPHKLLPHYVWIRGGRVAAITGSEEVSEEHIRAFLEGRDPGLHLKQDTAGFDGKRPLLTQAGAAGWEAVQHHSLLTAALEGLPSASGLLRDTVRGSVRLFFTHARLLTLLQYAYDTRLPPSRILLELAQPARLRAPDGANTPPLPTYNYELTLPLQREGALHRYMQEDLERYFSLRATTEVRPLKCLVLREEPGAKRSGTGKGKAGRGQGRSAGAGQQTFSSPAHLAEVLSHQLPWPVVSEVKGEGTLTLPLSKAGGLAHWWKVLQASGLTLTEEECSLEVLVIRDAFPQENNPSGGSSKKHPLPPPVAATGGEKEVP